MHLVIAMRNKKIFTLTLMSFFFLFNGLLFSTPNMTRNAIVLAGQPSAVLNPCNGLFLSDDESRNDTIPVATDYNYVTSNCQPARYQLVWLQPKVPANFDLFLFNDSGYSFLQTASIRTGSNLDWVVFRSDDVIPYYVIVNSSTDSGNVMIEWEDSSESILPYGTRTGILNETECGEMYEVYMNQTFRYDFQLELGSGADFDLYLYSLAEGEATNFDGAIAQSATTGVQLNEQIINWLPPSTGKYAVLVMRRSGSGTFTIRFDEAATGGGIPSFEMGAILFCLGLVAFLIKRGFPSCKIPQ